MVDHDARSPDAGIRRRSGRVLLVDPQGAALFFEGYLDAGDPGQGTCWMLPGGGVEAGESPRQAAARELREETGLVVAPEDLGPHVATTTGYADLSWARGIFRDDVFVHWVPGREVDISGLEDGEADLIVRYSWLTSAELAGLPQLVLPLGIGLVLADIVDGRIPGEPRVLPWHHDQEAPDCEERPARR